MVYEMNKVFLYFLCFFALPLTTNAQSLKSVSNRIDRLEQALEGVQKNLSNNYVGATKRPQAQGLETSQEQDGKLDAMLMQLQEAQENIRILTGEMETLRFTQTQIEEKMERINADVSFRFSDLEKNLKTVQDALKAIQAEKDKVKKEKEAKEAKQQAAEKKKKDEEEKAKKAEQQKESRIKQNYGKMTPKEIYDEGFAAIKKQHFITAQTKFEAFLTLYPDDELAGNAQYWLGESFFARSYLSKAAVAFAEGFQKYRQSPKAPDNLFKLGVTMSKLNKKQEACVAFQNFEKEFPKASESMKDRLDEELKKLSCP